MKRLKQALCLMAGLLCGIATADEPGKLLVRTWKDIPQTTIADFLSNNPSYPQLPTQKSYISSFDINTINQDHFAREITGWLTVPTTGNYTFIISGDDDSRFYLGTNPSDSSEANLVKICEVAGWTAYQQTNKYASQTSAAKYLVAGQKYYIKGFHFENDYGDHISVFIEGPGVTRQVIPSSMLSAVSANQITSTSTTAPTLKLTNTATNTPYLQFQSGGILQDTGSGSLRLRGVGSSSILTFDTNSIERMRITANGNIGIGTTSTSDARLTITPDGDHFTRLGYTGASYPKDNNSRALHSDGSISLTGASSTLNFPVSAETPTASDAWWMLGRLGSAFSLSLRTEDINNSSQRFAAITARKGTDFGAGIDSLSLHTGSGSTRLHIDSAGKVLIGTVEATGTSRLQVTGSNETDASTSGTLALLSSDATAAGMGGKLIFGGVYQSATGDWGRTTWASIAGRKDNSTNGEYGGYLSFCTRTNESLPAERMRISSTGNVGIGTSTPGARLELRHDSTAGTGVKEQLRLNNVINTPQVGDGQAINFYNGWASGLPLAGIEMRVQENHDRTQLVFRTRKSTTYRESMIIDMDGEVGIGTSAPQSQVHIVGNSTNTNVLAADSSGIRIQNSSGVDGSLGVLDFFNSTNTYLGARIAARHVDADDRTTELYFCTRGAGLALKEAMRIDSSGNVGIGTTTPTVKLEVNGNTKIVGNLEVTGTVTGGTGGGGAAVGGDNGNVQFNDGGAMGGTADLNWTDTTSIKHLNVGTPNATTVDTKVTIGTTKNAELEISRGTVSRRAITRYSTLGTEKWLTGMLPDSDDFHVAKAQDEPELTVQWSSGNVGIGTTTPGSKLTISDRGADASTYKTASIRWESGSSTIWNMFRADYVKSAIGEDRLTFIDGGLVNVLTLANGGHVGIGTTTPSNGTLTMTGRYLLLSDSQTMLGDNGLISGGAADGNTRLSFHHTKYFRITQSDTERMRISNDGNVMIGTTSDTGRRLQVESSGAAVGFFKSTHADGPGVILANNTANIGYFGSQKYCTGAGSADDLTVQATGNLHVTTGANKDVYFHSAKVHAKEIVVEATFTPADYVFEKDYKLRSLEEVEQHVTKHKHLPGIPSGNEIKKNGLSMGEMMNKQLEKIEELTLYTIQQQKQLDVSQRAVETVKAENEELKRRLERIEKLLERR